MAPFDLTINPVSIVAFVLTCLGCLHTLAAIFVTKWWSVTFSDGSKTYYGVWSRQECMSDGQCESVPATELQGGQEALFISKVFATFTMLLSLTAVVLHVVYGIIRKPLVRTCAIFMLGSAGLFGLLSMFVFAGFYHNVPTETRSTGVALYIFLVGTLFCLAAAVFTAWASVRKATQFELPDVDD